MANIKTPGSKKLLKIGIPALFYSLLIIFLVLYLQNLDFDQLKDLQLVWPYVLVATFIGLATRYLQVFIWFVLLSSLGAKDLGRHVGQLIYVYAKSWLGRYIPGTAPWILGKIYFASKHGVSKNKLAVSSTLEAGLQVTVVMAVAFLMLLTDKRLDQVDYSLRVLLIFVLGVCVIAMSPPVFNRLMALGYKLIKRKQFDKEHTASSQTISKGAALYVIGALMSGLSMFFISKAVYPSLSYHDLFYVMGASNLAGAVGMLAVFVPSGIGVRDGIQLVLLSVIIPKEIALVIVVFSRLWSVALDFIFFALSWLIRRMMRASTVASNTATQ